MQSRHAVAARRGVGGHRDLTLECQYGDLARGLAASGIERCLQLGERQPREARQLDLTRELQSAEGLARVKHHDRG